MPECHKCPVRPAPGTPWAKTPCKTCRGPSEYPSHKGVSHISMDAGAIIEGQTLAEVMATLHDARGHASFDPVNDIEPLEFEDDAPHVTAAFALAGEIIHRFTHLSETQISYVLEVFRNEDTHGAAIARRRGVSAQAVSVAFKNVMRKFPELRAVLPVLRERRDRYTGAQSESEPMKKDRPPPLEDPDAGAFVD